MKKIIIICFSIWVLLLNSTKAQYPADATPYTIDQQSQGTTPNIIPKQISPLNSPDIRVYPTTNTTQSEMSIAVSPLNPQIILASANTSDFPVTTIYGTGYYISTNGGSTWTGSDQPPAGAGNRGDPACVIDRNGYFYIGSIASNSGQGVMRSTNLGTTWNYFQVANPTSLVLDKNHLTVDNRISGTYSGNLYSAWSDFGHSDRRITIARSTNQGQTWISHQAISSGFVGAGLAHQGINLQVGSDGTVYACWAVRDLNAPFTERGIGFNKSTNGGQSWGTPFYAINNIKGMRQNPYPILGIRTNSFPVMGINMQTGRIYITWVNVGVPGINTGDPDVYIIYSDNGGTSWSTPLRVNNDQINNGALQFHCWLSVDPVTGYVYIVFYDNRASIGTNLCEFYIASSLDNGQSFINEPASDNSFSVGPLPGFAGNYNGEYPGVAALSGNVYPIWHSQVPSINAQGWTSPIANQIVNVTIDQRNSFNQQVGVLRKWEGSNFGNTFNPGAQFSFPVNSQQTILGDQTIIGSQKYNNWNNDFSKVKNHHTFTITTFTNTLISNLIPTHSGVTIKNVLEGTSVTGGTLFFRDPWFIDYLDPVFGNLKRNRGMADAEFKSRTSPFYPDYNTTYDGSNKYQGVFLNQEIAPNKPYYKLWAGDQQINLGGSLGIRNFYFHNWSSLWANLSSKTTNETDVVFTSANSVVSANLKGTQLSGNINAYTNNGQRKFVRTTTGILYNVYESMNSVWLESSTDNGQTWRIENNNKAFNTRTAKNPFIGVDVGFLYITFQEEAEDNSYTDIKIYSYWRDFQEKILVDSYSVYNPSHNNLNPVLSIEGYMHGVLQLWENSSNLYCRYGYFYGSVPHNPHFTVQWHPIQYNPDNNSYNPTVTAGSDRHYVAWEKRNGEMSNINYVPFRIIFPNSNPNSWYVEDATILEVSNGSGYPENYKPSIIEINGNIGIGWIGHVQYSEEYDVYVAIFSNPLYDQFWNFGYNVSSVNLNRTTGGNYVIGWNEDYSSNKYVRNTSFSSIKNFGINGNGIQINNGANFNSMYGMTLGTSTIPYLFTRSNSVGSIGKEQIGSPIASGRKGTIVKNRAQFYFAIGDLTVNGQLVDFVEVPDTISISDIEVLNSCLISNPFYVNDNSNFTYGVLYGITDSVAAVGVLGENDFVNFKVKLIDDITNEILGSFDDVTFNSTNLFHYNNISYQVNTQGLGNRTVRLKLVIDDNLESEYSLSQMYADESVLLKSKEQLLTYQGSLAVESYDLAQNYPNPFNPSTIIKYQIPEDGLVSLKIYDILGKEVKTLVNEQKSEGRYEIDFDASDLASGVYIYRIQVNDYVSSKKMMLLK